MDECLMIQNFINGKFITSDRFIDSYNPATGKVWAKIPDSDATDVDIAVSAASAAFPGWSSTPIEQRSKILLKIADILESRLGEFAELESRDQGKPLWLSKVVDIPRAVYNFRFFATSVLHDLNRSSILDAVDAVNYTVRHPVGVAGLISPWNLPMYLLTFKIAPAIAMGNTVVAKPSEMTSVTAWKMCEIFNEAGLPPGVVNIVFGIGPKAGETIVKHPQVPLISFTGGTVTAEKLRLAAAPFCKKLSLELGGKNPAVIFNNTDLEKCVEVTIRSSFLNQGEICLCTSRIYVQRGIYSKFVEKFVEAAKLANSTLVEFLQRLHPTTSRPARPTLSKIPIPDNVASQLELSSLTNLTSGLWNLKVGDPMDEKTFTGALISKEHLAKVKSYVELAEKEGASILCGKEPLDLPLENQGGYFMRPTVITDVKDDSRLITEEIFGPVTCILPFDTEEEVIRRANSVRYGLCATVWSSDVSTLHHVSHKLMVGTVWANCWLVRDLNMPFGGMKDSGIGREGAQDSVDFFTEQKTICIKL